MKNITLKIEKIIFEVFLIMVGVTFGLLMGIGLSDKFVSFKGAFNYSIIGLFTGNIARVICSVLLSLVILAFVIYWMIQSIRVKRYSFGPLYLIAFFLIFLFAVGYYQYMTTSAFNKIAFTFIMITAVTTFVITTYSLVMFIITMVRDEK